MRIIFILLVNLCILAACSNGKIQENPSNSSIYPSFPLGVSAEIGMGQKTLQGSSYRAQGDNPSWSISVTPGVAKVSLRGTGSKNLEAEFSITEDDKGGMITLRGIKGDLFLNLIKGECIDSASNTKYPFTATLFIGENTLEGCGEKTASSR